jgi:hypothetical protein
MGVMYAWKPLEEIQERMDPAFWVVPDVSLDLIRSGFPVEPLGEFIAYAKQGDVPRKNRGEKHEDSGVIFIEVVSISTMLD